MGRFRDLWASGKFILKRKNEDALQQQKQVAQLFAAFSPELAAEMAVPSQTRAIFDALKARRGQETGRWLREMAPAPECFTEAVAIGEVLNSFENTLSVMNALFKLFGDLAYEFNKTAIGTNLLISVALPTVLEKKETEEWYCPATRSCHARVTTRQWALIFSGRDKAISVLLLPAAMLLAFTTGELAEAETPPFMEMLYSAEQAKWTIGGEDFPPAAYPHLAKELLGDLIRVSSGVMSESEIFSRTTDKLILGENLAVGYNQQATKSKPAELAAAPIKGTEPVKAAEPSKPADVARLTKDVQPQSHLPYATIQDACDVVDETVDWQLSRLYADASKLTSESQNAEMIRREISAVEMFRTKVLEAFEQYAHAVQPIDQATPKPAPAELLV